MDIFDGRKAQVMLIGREEQAFDDPGFIYELKLDGDRCLAYLDGGRTELINRRGRYVSPHLPELAHIHTQASERCILDGELIVGSGMKQDFEDVRERLVTTNQYRLARLGREKPAVFVAHDILYLKDRDVLELPLIERKQLLEKNVSEDERLMISRFVEQQGTDFFNLVVTQGLEGVVGKRMASVYQMGKRSRDWVKFKNWAEDDFVICGYFPSDLANVISLVLGQFRGDELIYKSHVVLGVNTSDYKIITSVPEQKTPTVVWGTSPEKHHKTVWLEPMLVCRVEFMCLNPTGGLRQPKYIGLRDDKRPEDCLVRDYATFPHVC